jgi:hypothetical protein
MSTPYVHHENIVNIAVVHVSELVGWVRNVVLIKCIFGSGKPGGSGFWVGGYMNQVREQGS